MSRENAQAALAQSVERRLGKAEVGGSIPLGTSKNASELVSGAFAFLKSSYTIGV